MEKIKLLEISTLAIGIFLFLAFFNFIPLSLTLGTQYSEIIYTSIGIQSINGQSFGSIPGTPLCPSDIGSINGFNDCILEYLYITPQVSAPSCPPSLAQFCVFTPPKLAPFTVTFGEFISPGNNAPTCPIEYDGEPNVCVLSFANPGYNILFNKTQFSQATGANPGLFNISGIPPLIPQPSIGTYTPSPGFSISPLIIEIFEGAFTVMLAVLATYGILHTKRSIRGKHATK